MQCFEIIPFGAAKGLYFPTLGEFFRQYFFAMDREEITVNRAERDWIVRPAEGKDNTVAFGSNKVLTVSGTPIVVDCPVPYSWTTTRSRCSLCGLDQAVPNVMMHSHSLISLR